MVHSALTAPPLLGTGTPLAAAPRSADVTDWAARLGWLAGLALLVALVYWLMREGWKWRATLQSDLPELPAAPDEDPGPARLTLSGRYHGSTTAGQWLDRIVAHGLGTRSRVELRLTDAGLDVVRPGARDFFVPTDRLRGARLDKGIAGKVLTEGGLLVVTWAHGERLLDSGFRSDHPAEHRAWVEAVNAAHPERPAALVAPAAVDTAHTPHPTDPTEGAAR